MILVLISPRNAGLPFAQWLPEESGQLVAVTAAGAADRRRVRRGRHA